MMAKKPQLGQLDFFGGGWMGEDKRSFPSWDWVYIPVEEKFI